MGRLWVEQAIFIKCPCIASTTRAVSSSANTNFNFSITHTTYSKTFNLYLHSEINSPLLTANVVFQTAYICFRSRNAKKFALFMNIAVSCLMKLCFVIYELSSCSPNIQCGLLRRQTNSKCIQMAQLLIWTIKSGLFLFVFCDCDWLNEAIRFCSDHVW